MSVLTRNVHHVSPASQVKMETVKIIIFISNKRNVRSTRARSPAAIIPTLSGHSRHSNHAFSSSDSDSDPQSSSSSGPVQPSSSFRPTVSGSGSERGADGYYLDDKEVDDMMVNAFSGSLCHSDDDLSNDDVWYTRCGAISQLSSRHYDIPCGRRYVDFLCDEVNLLSKNSSSSERLLVFSSVVLHCDNLIKRTRDVVRTLNRLLDMWSDNMFDLLVQEAVRCDKSFKCRRRGISSDHFERVFTRLVWLRAASRWITERSKGSVLSPNDQVIMSVEGTEQSIPVVTALKLKHPSSCSPHSSILLDLPFFEDLEVSGSHVRTIAHRIQENNNSLWKRFFD